MSLLTNGSHASKVRKEGPFVENLFWVPVRSGPTPPENQFLRITASCLLTFLTLYHMCFWIALHLPAGLPATTAGLHPAVLTHSPLLCHAVADLPSACHHLVSTEPPFPIPYNKPSQLRLTSVSCTWLTLQQQHNTGV